METTELTGRLGILNGLGVRVIYFCEKNKWKKSKAHFDTNHLVTVIWDLNDLDMAGRCGQRQNRRTINPSAVQPGAPLLLAVRDLELLDCGFGVRRLNVAQKRAALADESDPR
jgi:hypothetical protein